MPERLTPGRSEAQDVPCRWPPGMRGQQCPGSTHTDLPGLLVDRPGTSPPCYDLYPSGKRIIEGAGFVPGDRREMEVFVAIADTIFCPKRAGACRTKNRPRDGASRGRLPSVPARRFQPSVQSGPAEQMQGGAKQMHP